MKRDPQRGGARRGPAKTVLGLAALSLLVAGALALLAAHDLERLGGERFERALVRLVERSDELARRAAHFDAERALAKLGSGTANGLLYRFDERVADASVEGDGRSANADASRTPDLPRFELEPGETPTFAAPGGEAPDPDGVLRLAATPGRPLVTRGPLAVDARSVGEIRIRMSAARGRRATLRWSDGERVLGMLALVLIPGETMRTYVIDAASLLRDSLTYDWSGAPVVIRELTLDPSDVAGDAVALDFVRFVSPLAAFGAETHGTRHADAGGELRACLFARTSIDLAYTLDLPPGDRRFRAGVAAVRGGEPVEVRVLVGERGARRELARLSVTGRERWRELSVDLSHLPAGPATLTLSSTSAAPNVALWSNPALWTPPRKRTHVVVLLEDTLRADRTSLVDPALDTTPFKARLFEEGVVFDNAFSQATKTRPSCPSLMTSLPPSATGVWDFADALDGRFVTLAEVLRSQGFETAAFVQNPNAGPAAGLHQGFSAVFDKDRMGRRAEDAYGDTAGDWIAAHEGRNLFLYLHLVDPHGPYDPPPPFDAPFRRDAPPADGTPRRADLDAPGAEQVSRAGRRLLYDGEVAHNDHALRAFVERLEAEGMLADTLLVFLSDHGEHLGEHDLWEHHPPGYAQVLHVPLALRFPGRLPAGARFAENVQLLDVMPTVLELVGIDPGGLLLHGDSLVSLIRGGDPEPWRERAVLSEEVMERRGARAPDAWGSLFVGRWHLLHSRSFAEKALLPGHAGMRLFDRAADPAERAPRRRFAADLLLQRRLRSSLRTLSENHARLWSAVTAGSGGAVLHRAEDLERLEELGYL